MGFRGRRRNSYRGFHFKIIMSGKKDADCPEYICPEFKIFIN
jgi:hypothetical protein